MSDAHWTCNFLFRLVERSKIISRTRATDEVF